MRAAVVGRGSPEHRALLAAGIAAVALAALWLGRFQSDTFLLDACLAVSVAVTILGLNIVSGYGGQLSLGHSAFYGLGAYVSAVLITDHGWPFLGTIPVAALFGAVAGFAIGLPALRLRGFYLSLITISLVVAFPGIAKVEQLYSTTGGANGKLVDPGWERPGWFPFDVSDVGFQFLTVALLAAVLFAFAANMMRSRVGRALVAIKDNEIAAAGSGVHLAAWKTSAFAISAAYAAIGGSLSTMTVQIVSPDTGGLTLAIALLMGLILGGTGTIGGALIGGIAVVWLPKLAQDGGRHLPFVEPQDAPLLSPAINGLVLILVMAFMPRGIAHAVHSLARRGVRVNERPAHDTGGAAALRAPARAGRVAVLTTPRED